MQLQLSKDEVRDLKLALDVRVRELHEELVHTDDRDYRKSLRDELDRLERLDGKLSELVEAGATVHPFPPRPNF